MNNLQVNDACFFQNHLPFPCPLSIQKTLELKSFRGCEGLHLPLSMQNQQTLSLWGKIQISSFWKYHRSSCSSAILSVFSVNSLELRYCIRWTVGKRLVVGAGQERWEQRALRTDTRGWAAGRPRRDGSDVCGRGNPEGRGVAFLRSPKQAPHCWLVNTILGEDRQSWALKTAERSEKNKARGIHSNWMKF